MIVSNLRVNTGTPKASSYVQDIWNVRKAKLKASIDMIEQDRAEGEEPIPANGALLNISDYTQLGEHSKIKLLADSNRIKPFDFVDFWFLSQKFRVSF